MDTRPSLRALRSGRSRASQIKSYNTGKKAGNTRRKRLPAPSQDLPRTPRSRPRASDIRRRRRLTLFALYAVLCVEFGLALLTSPALTIKKVRVYGVAALPAAEREQTLQAVRIAQATNWFKTPLRRLNANVQALPWVQSARVDRSFSTTLTAHVEPRAPFLIVQTGPTFFEADAVGTLIRAARPREKQTLPHVVFEPVCNAVPGASIGDPSLTAAIQIVQQLPREQAHQIAKIVIDQSGNICLNMLGGMQLQLGQAENVSAKITQLKSIYARDPGIAQTLATINLSCPSAPACTPRVAQPSSLLMGPLPPLGNVTP